MIRAPIYRIRTDVVHRALDDEHYLLSADGAFHSVSDPVGAFVLDLLGDPQGQSLDAIVRAVRLEFDAGEADVGSDVRTFLESLVFRGILERQAGEGET